MFYYINELRKMICHFSRLFRVGDYLSRMAVQHGSNASRRRDDGASLEGKEHKVVPYEPPEAGPGGRDARRYEPGARVAGCDRRGKLGLTQPGFPVQKGCIILNRGN